MKAFLLQVCLKGTSGSEMVNAKSFHAEEKAAQEELKRQNEQITGILGAGKIVVPTPDGPKVVCTVRELLGMLGVVGATSVITGGEVRGSIDVPSSRIILPNS